MGTASILRARHVRLLDQFTRGAFSHSAGTVPIITLFILGTPLQTTPLQKRA